MPREVAERLVDLDTCLSFLRESGCLVRVCSQVDPWHELAGIARHYEGKLADMLVWGCGFWHRLVASG